MMLLQALVHKFLGGVYFHLFRVYHFLLRVDVQLSRFHLLKRLLFPRQLSTSMWVNFQILNSRGGQPWPQGSPSA